MNKFSRYLKTIRELSGFNLSTASDLIGVSYEKLKKWESGFDLPFLSDLPRIARAYKRIPIEVEAVFLMDRFEMGR